jgi:hypothetical protein
LSVRPWGSSKRYFARAASTRLTSWSKVTLPACICPFTKKVEVEFSRPAEKPKVSLADARALGHWRDIIPEHKTDYVPLNGFM